MMRIFVTLRHFAALSLAMLLLIVSPGCSGPLGESRLIQAFKIGGAPGGQTEPEPVYDDPQNSESADDGDDW